MRSAQNIKLMLLIIAFISIDKKTFSQASGKENPIIFFDYSLGGAFGNAGGFALGFGINYQVNRSLFTARYTGTVKFGVGFIDPFIPLPYINVRNSMGEVGVLYGLRFIDGGQAYSFSLGASYSGYNQNYDENGYNDKKYDYFGVPFEGNIKWFKKEKKRFRIYGLIPVGKHTAFGGAIGFKLFGNISKQTYAGIGVTYGLGFHKEYD